MNSERIKEVITELNKIEWEKLENLDSVYKCLVELDYLLHKHRYKKKYEYIDKIMHNLDKFYIESDYSKKRDIFMLIKTFYNILNRYIL